MSLPRFSVHNPILVNMLMILVIVVGGLIALTTTREMFPESRPEKLIVTTVYPGVSPAELEKAVTVKVEEAVRDVEGIEKVDSTIIEGMTSTILTLRSDAGDVDVLLQQVKAEVDSIEDLPADAEKTTVRKLEPKLPVISVAVFGPGEEAARKRAARQLRDELLLLPGVSEVVLNGSRDDEISVEIRPERLLEYNITFDEVAQAIRDTNLDLSGGQLEGQRHLLSVRTLGEKQRGAELRSLPVRSLPDGRHIVLSDVAEIHDGFVESDLEGYFNGQPAISCVVYKSGSQDAIDISQLVKAYVKGKQGQPFDPWGFEAASRRVWYQRPFVLGWMQAARLLYLATGKPDYETIYRRSLLTPLPHNFQLALHTDLARFVEGRIELMVDNGIQGLVLVLLALVVFLNWRVAFWAAAGLPVTMLGTFIIMSFFGVTLNLVSLMGLIIVLSIDVDEAIVMAENVYRYMEEGYSAKEAAIKGAEEVMWPIVVMTGTTIGAFFPLMFMQGQLGDFLKVLPLVCVAAMTMSMIEALVILPSHLGHLPDHRSRLTALAERKRQHLIRRVFARLGDWHQQGMAWVIDHLYDRFIRAALSWRYVTLAAALASLSIALGLKSGGLVRDVWVQKMDSETLMGALKMPVGTTADQTRVRLQHLSDFLSGLPEVVNVQMFVARQYDLGGEGMEGSRDKSHLGQIIVELKEADQRARTSEDVLGLLRDESAKLSGVNAITWQALNGGPAGRSLELNLSSERFEVSLAVAERLKQKLNSFAGVFDIDDNLDQGQREVRLELRDSARSTGITVATLGNEVRNAFYGREARRVSRDREDVKIMVRYPKSFREAIGNIEAMWIPAPPTAESSRGWVPLGEVARLSEASSYGTLHRTQQRRSATVFADVDEGTADETAILAAVQSWFDSEIAAEFPDVRLEVLGKTREVAKARGSIFIAFPVSILIIYMLLAALFRSYIQPLAVMIAIPFGVQGAIIGHWIMGYDMTILSYIGLVALNGIVDNDSLVLVDFINNRVRAGLTWYEASVEGSKLRLRAIILTTITTTVGMFPLMMETSFQAKFLIPMAITLSFGLAFATVLTLVVVPCINMVFIDLRQLAARVWNGPETPAAGPPSHERLPAAPSAAPSPPDSDPALDIPHGPAREPVRLG